MFLLRSTDRSVTDVCFDVGFASLGTFSRTFHEIVGESPTSFRLKGQLPAVPPYGIDIGVRDPFGNHIRIVQPKA